MGNAALAPSSLLWRLWVAPDRVRAPQPPRKMVTTWGSRERRIRRVVRVVAVEDV